MGTTLLLVALILLVVISPLRARRDSYHLRNDHIDSWTPYGGVWALDNGLFTNNSDERGAKLMSGSLQWTNVALAADVRLDQSGGDAGLMIRSNDEDLGVDAYNGYYAGLRAREGTLIAGRSNYSWSEVSPVVIPGGVHERVWYHLQVVMYGCRLGAFAENLSTHQTAYLLLHEGKCVPSGRIGLRSLSTGGQWRNVSVAQSTEAQLNAIAARAGGERNPQPLTTEVAYAKHFSHYEPIEPMTHEWDAQLRTPDMHLGDLAGLRRDSPSHVLVRGVVTLTDPDIFIEDSTGGAMIKHPQGPHVNVGEGVEISGEVHPLLYSTQFTQSSLRIISTGTPAPPLSVTPWQAASGAYDARFIETQGHLLREVHSENGYQVLDLSEGGEVFRALYPDRYGQALNKLRVNSLVRLRGVCVLGKVYTQDLIPFLIFLRSSDDVQVLQGPPWWTPWHLAFVAFFSVLLACSIQLSYFRFRQWQKDAISRERERIAHDIHDTMAQSFAGIGYQIQGLRTSIIRNTTLSRDEIAHELASTSDLVSRCHADASHTIEMLGGVSPEEAGDLLGMLAERTYKLSEGKIRAYKKEQGMIWPLRLRVRATLFHIGQEVISNAITHGVPATITFTMRYEKRSATMMIVDDGRGFDVTTEEEGFGIRGMRRRTRDIGGSLEILSAPGVGTRVDVTFPLSRLDLVQRFMLRGFIHRRSGSTIIPES